MPTKVSAPFFESLTFRPWHFRQRIARLRDYTIIPAATVSLVPGSMRMKEPVLRALPDFNDLDFRVGIQCLNAAGSVADLGVNLLH